MSFAKAYSIKYELRPPVQCQDSNGLMLPPIDDDWTLSTVDESKKQIELRNDQTHHVLVLGFDNVKEFRTPHFLLLRCDVTVRGSNIQIEPHQQPRTDSEDFPYVEPP